MKKSIHSLLVMILAFFMLIIFGPAEIFFKNYREFGFVFQEFGWLFLGVGIGLAAVLGIVIGLFPTKLQRLVLGVALGGSIAAYVQYLLLNRGVKSIGQDAFGNLATSSEKWMNFLLWLLIIALTCILVQKIEKWQTVISVVSGIILGMQVVAYVSLFVSADEEAFRYATNDDLCLTTDEQFIVSANDNVIMILLDCFSNEYIHEYRAGKNDWAEVLKDFTYYNNADCGIYGTYPSIVHIITGHPLDLTQSVNAYTKACWENEQTKDFFALLQENNYKANIYVDSYELLTGGNPLDSISDKVNNVGSVDGSFEVDYPLLYKTMIKMSCYRYAPLFLKNRFYVTSDKYQQIATNANSRLAYYNFDFYNGLMEQGLSTTDDGNRFIFQHLNGTHEFVNDEYCRKPGYDDRTACIQGIFYMLNEYFNQLKDLGVYDNATIIVLSDHGTLWNGQPIFFIKEKGVTRDALVENNAPIDYDAIMPTIAKLLGDDGKDYGSTIYDYEQNSQRVRTFAQREYNDAYPAAPRFDGLGDGAENVYRMMRYKGDMWEFSAVWQDYEQTWFEPMPDCFY